MIIPRFRGKARDVNTDVARILPIRDAVAAALREADAELAGLTRRLEDTTARAAFLFGDDLGSDADDDPAAKAQLSELERFIVRGQMRQRYLRKQVAALREINAQLDAITAPRSDETLHAPSA